jgi:hypothetical protein
VTQQQGGGGGLIDAIVMTPDQGELRIELKGNLAAMLGATVQSKRSPENWRPSAASIDGCGGGI